MDVRLIDLNRISTEATQTRAGLRPRAVLEYAELIAGGVDMEPAVVFDDGERLHLAAGHHRRAAYGRAGRTQMPCVVKQGSKWDAVQYGIRDNLKHRGERVTTADKRHNIRLVLKAHPTWGDEMIADLCGATAKTVAKYRGEMVSTLEIPESSSRAGKDGRVRDTSNLGRKPALARAAEQPSEQCPAQGNSDEGGRVLGASSGEQVAREITGLAAERCRCGGYWVSDGQGGETCHASHPENRQRYPDEVVEESTATREAAGDSPKSDLVSGDKAAPPKKPMLEYVRPVHKALRDLRKAVSDLGNVAPGAEYHKMTDHVQKADDDFQAWTTSIIRAGVDGRRRAEVPV